MDQSYFYIYHNLSDMSSSPKEHREMNCPLGLVDFYLFVHPLSAFSLPTAHLCLPLHTHYSSTYPFILSCDPNFVAPMHPLRLPSSSVDGGPQQNGQGFRNWLLWAPRLDTMPPPYLTTQNFVHSLACRSRSFSFLLSIYLSKLS